MSILDNVFSISKEGIRKIITIFGIKIKIKSMELIQRQQQKQLLGEIEKKIVNIKNFAESNFKILINYNNKNSYLIESGYEFERCKEFYEDIDKNTYIQKYKSLVKNLDFESIKCVGQVLSRIELVANKGLPLDLLSRDEKNNLEKLKNEFYPNILKLSDGCYAYQKYLLPIKHFEPSVFYYKHNIDNIKNLNLIKNKNIIDAGGYIGDSAVILKDYTDKKVFSFEPTCENYNLMLKTIELNDCKDKIIPVKSALGSKKEKVEIFIQSSGSSINRVITANPLKENISVITLDAFVAENKIDVGLIKVDIEGFEQEFIKGAINTIRTQKPIMLLSIYHYAKDFFDIKPYIESLDLGYKFQIVKPVDGGVRGEILLICEV